MKFLLKFKNFTQLVNLFSRKRLQIRVCYVNSGLALCKNLLFLFVEQSLICASWFLGSTGRSVLPPTSRPILPPTNRPVLSDTDDSDGYVGVRKRDFVGEERRRVQELRAGLDWSLHEVVGVDNLWRGTRQTNPYSLLCGMRSRL